MMSTMMKNMMNRYHDKTEDETSCGPLCPHPGCWQSNTRVAKGFPHLVERVMPPEDFDLDLDLPSLKVYDMLDDYGEDPRDQFPSKFAGRPSHDRSLSFPNLQQPVVRTNSIRMTAAPTTSPKSYSGVVQQKKSAFKVVEVQEVFEPEDLRSTWADTFVPKQYYVWVPNPKKKKKKKKYHSMDSGLALQQSKSPHSVHLKDLTEHMVPREIEQERLLNKCDDWPVLKKKRSSTRSPVNRMRQNLVTPRTRGSSRPEVDFSGISELLDLPREILVQVLEHTKQSDLQSRERIQEIIQRFLPPLERGNTNISLTSNELLQQKKMSLHQGNKNIRQPHLMETKPVFYLDDDLGEEGSQADEYDSEEYGSFKDLYMGMAGGRDLPRFKKPLPAINARASTAPNAFKLPSISLGLPELPTGIRQMKPFTYSKKVDIDFTLAPVPTPPTSLYSTETPGSDHGTTMHVNVPSTTRSEEGSPMQVLLERRMEKDSSPERKTSRESTPLHAVSPTFSTKVPDAPATTPATYQGHSPVKSAPAALRDTSGSTLTNTPQEHSREKVMSPGQSMSPDHAALRTIAETRQEYTNDEGPPMSRGRSVRFEIPEVPPPPSSPQESDKDSLSNMAVMNDSKPQSGKTLETTPIEVSIPTAATGSKSDKTDISPAQREISMVSSPEPWPSVRDADFDVTSTPPASENTFHGPPSEKVNEEEQVRNESANARNTPEEKSKDFKREQTPLEKSESQDEFVNKEPDPQSEVVKKIMAESRKADSPAPPPPSPEPKDEEKKKRKLVKMDAFSEEDDAEEQESEDEVKVSVTHISPKGGKSKSKNRTVDTFVNIDIPAEFATISQSQLQMEMTQDDGVLDEVREEKEEVEEEEEREDGNTRDIGISVQSTLAARTISEQTSTEVSSMVEPAVSQASHGLALSEDYSDREEGKAGMVRNWEGVAGSSEGSKVITEEQLNTGQQSSEQEKGFEMSEDGGDHEGYKEDLRKEYERMLKEREDKQVEENGEENNGAVNSGNEQPQPNSYKL